MSSSNPERVLLCQAAAQAFILAEDPSDGWTNQQCKFCTLTHISKIKDGLQVELYDKVEKSIGKYKWNPTRLKSRDNSQYLVLLVKPWEHCKQDDKYVTMTLKFHTDAGAEKWTSLSEQMVDKLVGLRTMKFSGATSRALNISINESKSLEEESMDLSKNLQLGKYTIVSSKVDWVSFWSGLNEKAAQRTLLPVNSVVEVTQMKAENDSRGCPRTRCKVVYLYYPHFSELTKDEVPSTGDEGWIKGNYLAKRSPHMPILSGDRFSEAEVAVKYEDEIIMMNDALKVIWEKLSIADRTLILRALRVTLQHVVVNPYRPRKLKKSNPKHVNIFIHEAGPDLLATVGFEVAGNEELFLPSVVAKTDLAKLILQKISQMTLQDLEEKQSSVKPKPSEVIYDNILVKLNVGGSIFQTKRNNLAPCTLLNLETQMRLSSGEYFIDRDPELFKHIMKYLRDKNHIPCGDENFLSELLTEAEYYGIHGLARVLEQKINSQV